ncbi:hypothetical protein MKW92_017333 [Papaver armeniacum]|nr:hypothetical protein MKW92_017333 [Papaver armeniacum]
MSPSMAPSMSGEELQQLLFSNDKSFAKDGEIMMLILVILFALFLLSLLFCCYLRLVKHSTANKEDDIENIPTYQCSTKPNLLLPIKTTRSIKWNGMGKHEQATNENGEHNLGGNKNLAVNKSSRDDVSDVLYAVQF